jgi:TonB-linked SusC/RagA family outer membrane protein
MKKRHIHILLFLSIAIILASIKVDAQKAKREKSEKITIESVVKDENGNPVMGATVYGNGGTIFTKTDASGKFAISIPENTDLFIEADEFESSLFRVGEYTTMEVLTLKTSLLLSGEKDVVNIGFGKKKRADIVDAISVINARDLVKYDNNQSIASAIWAMVPGLYSTNNIRNYGAAMTVVDGLPRDISTIKMSEVEQITFMKDLHSSILYGSQAVNGVIQVTTKRGQPYRRRVDVTGYYGISSPRALPDYLSSSEFMPLFNEARVNDGLSPLYSETDIQNYTSGNKYRYPSVDYYSSEYLKSVKPYSSVITELSGGNENALYYANLGWDRTGSILNFGQGANSMRNRFNVRGNVDLNITKMITSAFDVVGVFDNATGPTGSNYWSEAATLKPNLFAPLIPIDLVDPENSVLKGRNNDVDGKYLLGGTSSYQTNSIASSYSGGSMTNVQRTFSINNRIDFDLGNVIKGLGFHTNLSFDLYSRFDQSNTNKYATYLPAWSATTDEITGLTKYGTDARSGSQDVSNGYFTRSFGFYGMFDYDRTFSDDHNLGGSLLAYGNSYNWEGNLQAAKDVNLGLRLTYSYKKKYIADFSSAYANSVRLSKDKRRAFSPSLALAWVISSEDFMSSVSAIDHLKFRVSATNMNSDKGIDGYYYWEDVVYRTGTFYWYETTWNNIGTRARYGANPNLSWEKRKELNVGLEGIFFDRLLYVDANIFTSQYYDQITRPITAYPSFYGDFLPYQNFENNAYRGGELGLSLNKNMGDIGFVIGFNALYATTEVIKRDEIHTYDYQYMNGRPLDAIWGMVDDGFYMDEADIAGSPLVAFGTVRPGDIKYVDQNGDNFIDSDDQIQIGRSASPFSYGLHLKITYKNFTLFAKGSGRTGLNGMISNNYYWVDGNDKYSDFILNRWTEATKSTANFPRLSSGASSNNFRNSTFWLYDADRFGIDALQLTYNMPESTSRMVGMKNLSVFLNGYDLLMIAKNKEIMELAIGSEPYYRSFSIGIKTVF